MRDGWKKMLLLERIRELQDIECKFSMCADAADLLGAFDYPAAELRNRAISAYEANALTACERLCVLAEFLAVRSFRKLRDARLARAA